MHEGKCIQLFHVNFERVVRTLHQISISITDDLFDIIKRLKVIHFGSITAVEARPPSGVRERVLHLTFTVHCLHFNLRKRKDPIKPKQPAGLTALRETNIFHLSVIEGKNIYYLQELFIRHSPHTQMPFEDSISPTIKLYTLKNTDSKRGFPH